MTTEFNNAVMKLEFSPEVSLLSKEVSVLTSLERSESLIEELLENYSKDEMIKFIKNLSKGQKNIVLTFNIFHYLTQNNRL